VKWESSLTDLAKPDGLWAGSQPLIATAEQSLLRMRTATTASVFVVHAEETLTAFLELESTIRAAERQEDCGGRK
jgi:hypothetical protein